MVAHCFPRQALKHLVRLSTGAVLVAYMLYAGKFSVDAPFIQTVGYTLIALFFGSLLVLVLCARPDGALARCFDSAFLRSFGKYSYALYLFHLPLRALIRDTLFGPAQFPFVLGSQIPAQLFFYVISTALAFAFAFASWHLYEKQFLKLKRYFPSGSG